MQHNYKQSYRAADGVWIAVAAIVFNFAVNAGAAEAGRNGPLRLAVQPPSLTQTDEMLKNPGERATQCMALYLRDWLGAAPGVVVMDDGQYRAWFDEAMDSSRTSHPPYSLALFTAYLPLDAAVHWGWKDGKLTCGVCRADGERTQAFAYNATRDLPKLLGGATAWLCLELKLDEKASPLGKWLGKANPDALETAYLQRYFNIVWGDPGITKLRVLRPFMNEARSNGVVAEAFFAAGLQIGKQPDESPLASVRLLAQVLPFVLGTEQEELAIRFLKGNALERPAIENDLLEFVKVAGKSDVDQALEKLEAPDKTKALGGDIIKDTSMAADAASNSVARQCGAIRCLGAIHSEKVKPHLARATKSDDARVRAAVAFAWAQFAAPIGDVELKTLATDPDANVALVAALGLSARGQTPGNVAELARRLMKTAPRDTFALGVLAREGTTADAVLLQARLTDPDPARRALAVEGLIRLGHADADAAGNWLRDPDSQVVQTALHLLPASVDASLSKTLVTLANHPDWRVAEAARVRLHASLPADLRERRLRELATEHPYVRGQIVDMLARDGSPTALDDLEIATSNSDAHTRAQAMIRLAAKAPERAQKQIERLVADPHSWVRLHAAAAAAQCAGAAQAPFLKTAAQAEPDEATRLYLLDAVARAEGRTLPDPRPPVNKMALDRNVPFLCGHGPDAPNSPFQGYYDLAINLDAAAKTAHAAGKIFLDRTETVHNPARVLLSSQWRDRFWQALDKDLVPALPWLDGVVLGEETMSFKPFVEWAEGWRLFCREAGLDPLRVAGKQENLSELEKKAWWNWEQRVAIEGFNTIYDFVKMRYGKLRPGFAVCTFLPDQNGPTDFDRMWKFDIGAGYYYSTNTRYRYTQIRRFKTVWPDRPVLWLVNGVATSLSGQGGVKYDAKMPTTPIAPISIQPYADAICAWMAGAHTGNFTGYLFIDLKTKAGPMAGGQYLFTEDTYPGSKTLSSDVAYAFKGVDDLYRTKAMIKDLKPDAQIGKTGPADTTTLDEPSTKAKDRFVLQMESEMKRMETGFLLDSKRLRDCARLLTDLPFPDHAHNVLLIGDITASKGALRLPNDYDFLDSLGHVAGHDISSYRMIAVTDSDQALIQDEVISSVVGWLKTQPGLLYIHGSLSTAGTNAQPTVADLTGHLTQVWPWAAEVSFADNHYRFTGTKAAALSGDLASPRLVLWRGEGFRGGVLFDCSDLPPAELREQLNRLFAEKQLGVKFDGPIGMEAAAVKGLNAMASCRSAPQTFTLKGVDMLSGWVNPELAMSRSAALVAESYKGRYIATFNGVAVLADQPLDLAEPVEGGVRIRCNGLIQASGSSGSISVQTDGTPPPTVANPDEAVDWIVYKQTPGVAVVKRDGGGAVTFVRAAGIIVLKNSGTVVAH